MNTLAHFSIACDDVERAKRFYEAVFGWRIEAWGPPEYYLILPEHPSRKLTGDLHKRREPLSGTGLRGFECTISVADVRGTAAAVVAHGGRIARPEYRIEGVGNVIYFDDTEGNRFAAMKYD